MARSHPSRKSTILIAEDQSLIRKCTAAYLEDDGYRVLEAASGMEALAVLRRHPEVSLLLTDICMTCELDGFTLIENARRDYPTVRVVVASGKRRLDVDSLALGAERFIPKPYSPTQIYETVRQLLP